MAEKRHDIYTVPNALTAARLTASPYVAKRLYDDPAKWWLRAGLFAASDVVDGFLARSGEKSAPLRKLGVRASETGRKLDPLTDKVVVSEFVAAGFHKGIIPKPITLAALGQKAIASGVGLAAHAAGAEVQVNTLGKRSEFLTNVGLGSLFIAESIENQSTKDIVRGVGILAAATGIVGAFAATKDYISQAIMNTKQ